MKTYIMKTKFRRILIYTVLTVLYSINIQAQEVESTVILNSPLTTSKTVEATQYIIFKPGFNTNGISPLIARIVPENTYMDVVGTPYNGNEHLNWVASTSYDVSGNLTSSGIAYFNTLGKATQSQSLDIKTGKIWASEVRYDAFGRPTFNTLSAPVGENYGYKENFIQTTSGNRLSKNEIEAINENSGAIIGNQENSLGWYYSEANTSEKYQDITAHPYSKTEYSTLNPGIALKTYGGNKVQKPGNANSEWLQSYSFSMPITQEPFYEFGWDYFKKRSKIPAGTTEDKKTPNPSTTSYYVYNFQSCSDGTVYENKRLIDNESLDLYNFYKVTVNGKSGFYKVTAKSIIYINDGGNDDIGIEGPGGLEPGVGTSNGPELPDDINAYAFLEEKHEYTGCPLGEPYFIRGKKTIVRDVHGIETVVFTDADDNVIAAARSGNEEGEKDKQTVISPIGKQKYVDIHLPKGCSGIELVGKSMPIRIYNLITETYTSYPNATTINLPAGFYRIEIKDTNSNPYEPKHPYVKKYGNSPRLLDPDNTMGIKYQVNYYDYTLNYYDKSNRLIKSTQPIGKQYASTFKYNTLGQLLETTNIDEGKAIFKYRKDGQIRFSQNTKQKLVGEFSYTNYDTYGRPIESGIKSGSFADLDGETSQVTGGKEIHRTIYDVADDVIDANDNKESLIEALHEEVSRPTSGFSLANLLDNYSKPQFLAGNVVKTYTEAPKTNTTWYSYDIYGRVIWIVQKVEGLGLKTIDYEYDFTTGQVTQVIYQKYYQAHDSAPINETFVHRYTYNIAGELFKVETANGLDHNFTEQAKYEYYETGALKRVEIAENVQGVDYIYNLNGQLKAINHPSRNTDLDPGKDGTNGITSDLFGFALDYYNGDYLRSNTPTPVTSGQGHEAYNQYNGNIKATRWSNNVGNDAQVSQLFSYNKNNWLTQADFGLANNSGVITPNSHGNYKVFGLEYDANGNIQKLNRNKNGNAANAMDRMTYTYKDTKPNQLDHVEDPINAGVNDMTSQEAGNYMYNTIGQLIVNKNDDITYTYNASGLVTKINKMVATNGANAEEFSIYNEDYSNHPITEEPKAIIAEEVPLNPIDKDVSAWSFSDMTDRVSGAIKVTKPLNCDSLFDVEGKVLSVTMKEKTTTTGNVIIHRELNVAEGKLHNFSMDIIKAKEHVTIANVLALNPQYETTPIIQYPLRISVATEAGQVLATQVLAPTSSYTHCNVYKKEDINLSFTPENVSKVKLSIEMLASVNDETTFYIDNERLSLFTEPVLAFYYDDKGQRIRKVSYNSNPSLNKNTHYVRDAAGSVMAIYENNEVKEVPIYGASRLGIYNKKDKSALYQLADHLGNVRAVIQKKKSEITALSATDYYPFGMAMPGREVVNGEPYRYAYQGQEKDPETGKEAFQLRLWDGRIGRWLTIDPKKQYASPYLGMGNNPIIGIDPDGGFCPKCPDDIYVELSDHVYNNDLAVGDVAPNDWVVEELVDLPIPGFQGAVYSGVFEGKKEYIFITRGTSSLADGVTDITQLSGESSQFTISVAYASYFSDIYENISFGGHSLGGGLASANALATGGRAVTFNAAGLSGFTKEKLNLNDANADITAYVVEGEIVDHLQRSIGLKAEGNIIILPASYPESPSLLKWFYGTKSAAKESAQIIKLRTENHMMKTVLQHFK